MHAFEEHEKLENKKLGLAKGENGRGSELSY